jgi:hypothetical protein
LENGRLPDFKILDEQSARHVRDAVSARAVNFVCHGERRQPKPGPSQPSVVNRLFHAVGGVLLSSALPSLPWQLSSSVALSSYTAESYMFETV